MKFINLGLMKIKNCVMCNQEFKTDSPIKKTCSIGCKFDARKAWEINRHEKIKTK